MGRIAFRLLTIFLLIPAFGFGAVASRVRSDLMTTGTLYLGYMIDADGTTHATRAIINDTGITNVLPGAIGTTGTVLAILTSDGVSSETLYWATAGAGSGDIEGVTAGSGLTGGGVTGTVTVDVGAGTGITVNANDVALTVPVDETLGGTGQTTIAVGDLLHGTGVNTLGKLTKGTADQFLKMKSDASQMNWGSLAAGTNVTIAHSDTVTTISASGGGAGDIESVTAGNGLTGGGVTGAVTLDVGEGFGIDAAADAVALDPAEVLGSITWGDGSTDTIIWTWNRSSAGDPAVTLGAGNFNVTTGQLQEGGVDVALSTDLHSAVTLASDADTLLGLSTQQLTLDVQNANKVFAGPTTGGDADPTFRALVAADIPDLSSVYQPLDADLTDLAGLSAATGDLIIGNGTGDWTKLAIGTTSQVLTVVAGKPGWRTPTGGSGTPGGSDTHVQYNDGGAFGGEAAFVYNKTSDLLTVSNLTTNDNTIIGSSGADTLTVNALVAADFLASSSSTDLGNSGSNRWGTLYATAFDVTQWKWQVDLNPTSAKGNYTTAPPYYDSSDIRWDVLRFDDTTTETASWNLTLPRTYNSAANTYIDLYYVTYATFAGNSIDFGAKVQYQPEDTGATMFGEAFGAECTATETIPIGTNFPGVLTITMTNMDSATAGKPITLVVRRRSQAATDTAFVGNNTGDMGLYRVVMYQY